MYALFFKILKLGSLDLEIFLSSFSSLLDN
jgi:hypothetical protein